jgi:6-phosphofructokinase 1
VKRIAVLTSGGDAPGMNAAIRAIVRCGLNEGWEVFGVHQGFAGLIDGNMRSLSSRDVGGILQQGGTVLGTARAPEFTTEEGLSRAVRALEQKRIDGVAVIGGNGSQSGAHALSKRGVPVVGVASTIDNDLVGSEITIGVDTALNIALEAIDRLKVTASSHHRAFIVEVMGRNCGYIALMAGIAGGAEAVMIPEVDLEPEALFMKVERAYDRGKAHALVVVAEGARYNAQKLVEYAEEHRREFGYELRATTLGHVQRGGAPGAFDRLLATRLGAAAVTQLASGEHGVLMGQLRGEIVPTPLEAVTGRTKGPDLSLFNLVKMLAK